PCREDPDVDTEATRALVKTYYDTLASGDRRKLASLFTEDVEWIPPESAPFEPVRGADEVARQLGGALVKAVFDPKTLEVRIRRMVADGDAAVVQQTLSARTLDGASYENEYCWVYVCRDGRISRIEEYVDTWKAARILNW
ncbi:MAG: nuclear transport factor 2 family protein, partial [Planctomycetota bacterium]